MVFHDMPPGLVQMELQKTQKINNFTKIIHKRVMYKNLD